MVPAAAGQCAVLGCQSGRRIEATLAICRSRRAMWNPANRRHFLGHFSAGILTAVVSRRARASTTQGANRKLVVGLIGCGGRGVHDAGLFRDAPDVELAYVCDVDESRRLAAAENLGVDAAHVVSDMRRVLDDPVVDAVIVATP